ncbi:hypothetical protein [Bradyrhizobium sp. HKCCYLRH1030]|uniref:hypothetical protein n=1 Tax=Bradyrhizobium sp. HKCCYLRH1030 TaxID=3420744 RepID=UPI003EBA01B2
MEITIDQASVCGDAVIAVHAHPGGFFAFSGADDKSDRVLMKSIRHGPDRTAGSSIMIPSGVMRARGLMTATVSGRSTSC